ncbi:MAG: RNA polymerase sigma factor [Sphingomonas sp.]
MPVTLKAHNAVERPTWSTASGCHNAPTAQPGPPDPAEASALTQARLDHAYRTHGARLQRYFRRRFGDDAAHDLTHETFARLANSGRVHQLAEPAAYLWRVARNLLFERTRQQKRCNVVLLPLEQQHEPASAPHQELDLEAADLLRTYEKAIAGLPPKTRRVYLMQRVDELTYREIHEQLGISIATVEYHMMKALAHIERIVDAER